MNLYQDVFFRFTDSLRGRNTIKRLHQLRQSQDWNLQRIRRWQLERLNRLLDQARTHSPYYAKRLTDAGLPLSDLAAIEQLPVLTKDEIREHQQQIKCGNFPESAFIESRTGGSTGRPMFYYLDRPSMDWNRASVYRAAEWGGTALGEKAIHMSGSHFDYTRGQTLLTRLTYFLQRYRDYSTAVLTEAKLEEYYQGLMKYRPQSIWGYAGGIFVFSDFIESTHPEARLDFIKSIFPSSETLLAHQRETIGRVFGADKIFDQYGAREMYMASECRAHQGYHFHAEVILGEVVDRHGRGCQPGEMGNVLLTDLSNLAFPFIRYEIGDIGVLEEDGQCECGMWLPRLRKVEGRIGDIVTLSDRILTGPNFATLFSDKRGIANYQIRQESFDEIRIVMVPDQNYSDEFEQYVKGAVESMVDEGTRVVTELVDDIEVPESGKRQYIISKVSRFKYRPS